MDNTGYTYETTSATPLPRTIWHCMDNTGYTYETTSATPLPRTIWHCMDTAEADAIREQQPK